MRLASQLLLQQSNLRQSRPPSFSCVLSPRFRAYNACRMSAQPQAAAPAAVVQKVKKPAVAKEAFFVYAGPPPDLVDIGCNLTDWEDGELDEVVERATSSGVRQIIITGTSVKRSRVAIEMAERLGAGIFATAGVHPHDAKSCGPETLPELERLAAHPRCVAIGECGLDFNRNFSPPEVQEEWFVKQIELAIKLKKPLFMHCRDAAPRFVELFRPFVGKLGAPAVVHCFTGTAEEATGFIELGLHIGFTGWLCDDREGRAEALGLAVKAVPLEKLLIETDAPYLVPRSIKPSKARPKRNEPCLLPHVAAAVAQVKGMTVEEVASLTTANARRVFGLPASQSV